MTSTEGRARPPAVEKGGRSPRRSSGGASSLCLGCFREQHRGGRCRGCGFDPRKTRSGIFLPLGTLLDDHYIIGRPLGSPGGFGITYLAWHDLLRTRVAIKEFLPRRLVTRDGTSCRVIPYSQANAADFEYGLDAFCREAQILEQLEHRHIVRVRAFFLANGTGYMVMSYYDGETLDEHLHRHGGSISQQRALELMAPILDALEEAVHAKDYLHRDISPQNIYLAKFKNGEPRPLLLDFGAARLALGGHTQSLSVILKPGYAPYEQYGIGENRQGPWTDVYACAATLYRAVTGVVPVPAFERLGLDTLSPPTALKNSISRDFSDALMAGLAVMENARPQAIDAFRQRLYTLPPPIKEAPEEAIPTPFLRILKGEMAEQEIPLDPDEYIVLGRDPSVSNLVFSRQDLSRQHCALRYSTQRRRFEIQDLETANGTFLVDDGQIEGALPARQSQALDSGRQFCLVDQETLMQVIVEERTTRPERPMDPPDLHSPQAPPTVARPAGCLMVLLPWIVLPGLLAAGAGMLLRGLTSALVPFSVYLVDGPALLRGLFHFLGGG